MVILIPIVLWSQPISSTSLTVSPAIELDEIDIDCSTGDVTIEVLNIPLSCSFSVYDIYPTTIATPPSNNHGLFNLSGATSATFHIDNGGCIMDSIVTFGCGTSLGLGSLHFQVSLSYQSTAQISWELIETEDITSYEVFQSQDLGEYGVLTTMAIEPSDTHRSYTVIDTHLLPGPNYYRLCIHKSDGDSLLSDIRQVNYYDFDHPVVYIYPNPSDGNIIVKVYCSEDERIDLKIMDNLGRIVRQEKNRKVESGPNEINLSISGYADAIYMLYYEFEKSGKHGVEKIVKKH